MEGPLAKAFVRILDEFIDVLKQHEDLKCYADKVQKWDRDFFVKGAYYESKPMKCGLQVLCHGDVWTNNIMFKSNPITALMLDFQMCFWGSQNYDLLLFIASSVHDDVKAKHFDELIEFYFQEFVTSLGKVKYEDYIPTLEDFKEDVHAISFIRRLNFYWILTNA